MKLSLSSSHRRGSLALASILLALAPAFASASEGDSVVLRFGGSDRVWLFAALLIGFVSLAYGFVLSRWVLSQSPGDQKMQDVGLAIKEGALAYLKKQIGTMVWFVLLLMGGLYGLYLTQGGQVAALMALCFLAGVVASYVAGYTGMTIAVSANMRVADAARRSYKRALEIGFKSGAVAGLVTVGVGLVGASTILLAFPERATTLLVGFGFGGSLAALFMRVGGGIFTKAADVGADLVGKVEAGIPEDDPRNPAVIADNVGDNVGDCAGMAADVFESYAVTLVAAIVLGAATSAVFEQSVWTKLVLFALVAKGVGIVASIIGMQFVKGSDNLESDPLKPIRRGFYTAAAASVAGIALVAMFLMRDVQTSQVKTKDQYAFDSVQKVRARRDEIAKRENKAPYEITPHELAADPEVQKMGIIDPADNVASPSAGVTPLEQRLQTFLVVPDDYKPTVPAGYQKVTSADRITASSPSLDRALNYVMPDPDAKDKANPVTTIRNRFLSDDAANRYEVVELSIVARTVEEKDPKGAVINPATNINRPHVWVGPIRKGDIERQIAQNAEAAKAAGGESTVKTLQTFPVDLYYSAKEDRFILAADGDIPQPDRNLNPSEQLNYFAIDEAAFKKLSSQANSQSRPIPPQGTIALGKAEHLSVPWWLFVLPVAFGVLMGLVIEAITNYYVSTSKRPTREVAGVSTAGAAPMIIQGFASAAESSVFMVLAIVAALLVPLYIFPATIYGTTILAFYGAALVGLGLLTTTGFVLAMDTFGPISDNAQGVYEMSGADKENHQGAIAVGRLDAAGNTTKALTKGFAIATAVIAAVALFHSFVESAHLQDLGLRLDVPEIFLGLLIGGAAPYLFSAFSINAVGRAAFELINEVRRQFRGDAGILKGTSKPDYGRCVAIVTAAAQRELLGPGILAIFLPMAVAFGFSIGKAPTVIGGESYNLAGAQALGGFLAGAIVSGQLMAVLLSNAGGMWDNAKKIIEDGEFGGKGSDAHKASVVCDTVGDPFKDTAGPALNPLIKVMNLVALLLVGVVVRPLGNGVLVLVTVMCVALLGVALFLSKKGSIAETMQRLQDETPSVAGTEDADPAQKPRIVVGDEHEHPVDEGPNV